MITAKEAIKERCRDCCDSDRVVCAFDTCQLKGLYKSQKGCNRTKAIADYCRWCMNGNHVSMCVSVNCAIYKYRNQKK